MLPATTSPATAAPPTLSSSIGPSETLTDLSGEVYGFIRAVDLATSQITLDKVDWFTGAAAQQACAEDGVQGAGDNWCTGYYYRNVNPALRAVAVSPQATITTLSDNSVVASDLATVASRISSTPGPADSTYRLIVVDSLVTDLREMYRP